MAISDLINVVLTIHCWSIQLWTDFADEIMVPISYYLIYVTYTASEYLTVLLSIHRSAIVSHPAIAMDYFTKSKVKIYIGCIYVFSILICITRIFEYNWDNSSVDGIKVYRTEMGCGSLYQITYMVVICTVFKLAFPSTIMVFTYIQLLRKVGNCFKDEKKMLHFVAFFQAALLFPIAADN